jgi:hypothetical protein
LNGHLQIIHGTSHEEYRGIYGLPWRRGLVSPKVSNRLSKVLTERIRNGSFKPEPDNKAAVARILAGRRRDQPFVTLAKSELGKEQSKKNLRYTRKDFENVLSAMLNRKTTLRQVCMTDKNLPSRPTVLYHAESKFQEIKHLGLWEVKPRPPPRMAKSQPLYTEPHIDYSDSQDAPSDNGSYVDLPAGN